MKERIITGAVLIALFVPLVILGGIPFYVKLPPAPMRINADYMNADEIRNKLKKGYDDVEAGRVYVAAEAFEEFGRKIK